MQLRQLKHLKELELIHAALSDVELALPESIEKLALAYNRFTAVPAVIRRCRNLTELDLSAKPITQVPPWTGELSQLEGVFLRDTRIMKVGVEVVALKRLRTLDGVREFNRRFGKALMDITNEACCDAPQTYENKGRVYRNGNFRCGDAVVMHPDRRLRRGGDSPPY